MRHVDGSRLCGDAPRQTQSASSESDGNESFEKTESNSDRYLYFSGNLLRPTRTCSKVAGVIADN